MINTAIFITLIGFAFSSAFTPGPNNFMLMSSGALFGFKRTIPHISGVAIGFNFVLLAALFGMGALIEQFPWMLNIVKIAGASWLAWLGIKFFMAALSVEKTESKRKTKERSRPFKFYEAVLFQWVNPKALIMAVAAASAYIQVANTMFLSALLICGTFLFMGVASATTWTIAGGTLNRMMSGGRAAKVLNIIMGVLLIGTALMILLMKAH